MFEITVNVKVNVNFTDRQLNITAVEQTVAALVAYGNSTEFRGEALLPFRGNWSSTRGIQALGGSKDSRKNKNCLRSLGTSEGLVMLLLLGAGLAGF